MMVRGLAVAALLLCGCRVMPAESVPRERAEQGIRDVESGQRTADEAIRDLDPEEPVDWSTLIAAIVSTLLLGTPTAVTATNMVRDRRRVHRGEVV